MGINIKTHSYDISRNTTYGRSPIKYIVLHYTATNKATAYNELMYFATNPSAINASADYFVDDTSIWQYNTKLDTRYSWAVGDGIGSGAAFSTKCYNSNQVSIEMSCTQSGGKWYISDATYKNALELTKYLMAKYNVSADRVIRHHDVSGKLCPGVNGWIARFGSDATWKKFKAALTNTSSTTSTTNTTTSSKNTTNTKTQTTSTNNGTVKAGAYVTLSSNATYYDGKAIPSWVKAKTWIVNSINGDRVVIDKSVDGQHSIMSAVNKKYVSLITNTTTAKTTPKFTEYKVKITVGALNIRKGAGTNYSITGTITDRGVYTIVGEATGTGATKWLKLKSGAGYIASDYTKKV